MSRKKTQAEHELDDMAIEYTLFRSKCKPYAEVHQRLLGEGYRRMCRVRGLPNVSKRPQGTDADQVVEFATDARTIADEVGTEMWFTEAWSRVVAGKVEYMEVAPLELNRHEEDLFAAVPTPINPLHLID